MTHTSKLPVELQYIAQTELNEVADRVNEDISYIRTWLLKQPHLRARTDDDSILIFLRSCKFSLEKTKRRLDLFYTVKSAFSDVFQDRNPFLPKLQHAFQDNIAATLPTLPGGPGLFLVRAGRLNPDVLSVNDALKLATIALDVMLREDANYSIAGQGLLVDFKDVPTKFFFQATPTFVKRLVVCLQNAYPSRVKYIHFINVPSIWVHIFNIFKSFLPNKLQTRVFCHDLTGKGSIEQHFPPSVLPMEYGGEAGPFNDLSKQFRTKAETYSKWFIEEEKYVCIEEKRPTSSHIDMDLFSIDGSFRRLQID